MPLLKPFLRLLRYFSKIILSLSALALIALLAFPIGFYGMALYLEPSLPSLKEIKMAQRQMPLQVYSYDNKLVGHYGNRMSLPISYEEIPKNMTNALLAAEDQFFFEHSGISVKGLGRAVTELLTGKDSQSGGSTITMQVAKNYFLTPEQTFKRKLTELFLSRKIEQQLSKDEILTLYVNKIYLGEGAYGVRAAAKKYYSKSLDKLSIAEYAMIAGLPKAPSAYNPVINPKRALIRRNWILKRMLKLNYINQEAFDIAVKSPINLRLYKTKLDTTDMLYLSEMARISLVKQFGSQVMNSGWRIRLTVDSEVQSKADNVVKKHLYRYDKQHGWRGAEAHKQPLSKFNTFLDMHPAKVIDVGVSSFKAELKSGDIVTVPWSGMGWRKYHSANYTGGYFGRASSMVKIDDIVRLSPVGKSWKLVQVPKIQASLVSVNPDDGAIIALVGGFHFLHSKFNRATDAWRQPGSTIKPLIYSAALEKGFLPTSIISDSPLRIGSWKPKNSDGRYYGPMELRRALYLSRNLVSIRLLRSVGMANARNLLDQFGLDKEKLPTTLSLALGAGKASPLQMATAYATFANGGHRIQPYLIKQIYGFDNKLLYQANPEVACAICVNGDLEDKKDKDKKDKKAEDKTLDAYSHENPEGDKEKEDKEKEKGDKKEDEQSDTSDGDRLKVIDEATIKQRSEQAPRILSPSVSYEMANILRDVIQRGTAKKARSLGRGDIGGKTGTTNDFRDAWFAGFHPTNATVVWMGFDQPSTLGKGQYGGKLALPVWMDFMRFKLKETPAQWVTLNNQAKSKKQKADTIDLTDKDKEGKKVQDSEGKELKDGKEPKDAQEPKDDAKKGEEKDSKPSQETEDKKAIEEESTDEQEKSPLDKLPTGIPQKRALPPAVIPHFEFGNDTDDEDDFS